MPTIEDVNCDKATYRPSEAAYVTVAMANEQDADFAGSLVLTVAHLDRTIMRLEQAVAIAASGNRAATFRVEPTADSFRGYGLDAILYGTEGEPIAEGSGAFDVLARWSDAPRYGFLADFAPGQGDVAARCDRLARYHLNVVQFYDWMWRHYQLLPPQDDFSDALGRQLSLGVVREAIAGVQARGGAALAYGAVYGAEPEFADRHLELALYDEAGSRISLAELFYIMNIAPDSPWVPLIVSEFAAAVSVLGFDGIHLDQYGFPKTARDASGEWVDLAHHFPPLIERARAAVVAAHPAAGVIFNAVGNWPIERVAPTSQDAVYIEVWPPDESYNDLRRLIREAKRLGGGKQVILAAYISPFLEASEDALPQAETAALLVTAAIYSSGGFHLLLGERDGILCDPYYPKYARLRPQFAARMKAYYDFIVRYEELISSLELNDAPLGVTISELPLSEEAQAGAVWVIARHKPGYHIIHLINLTDQSGIHWNAPHQPPPPHHNLRVTLHSLPPLENVYCISPDANFGKPMPLAWQQYGEQVTLQLDELENWSTVVCRFIPTEYGSDKKAYAAHNSQPVLIVQLYSLRAPFLR